MKRKKIDDMRPGKFAGLFDDQGYKIKYEIINKPSLCITCINDKEPDQDILCNLTRYDQSDAAEFKCFAYRKIKI